VRAPRRPQCDEDMEFLGTSSNINDHDIARVDPDKTDSRADGFQHVDEIGHGTRANVGDCLSRSTASGRHPGCCVAKLCLTAGPGRV